MQPDRFTVKAQEAVAGAQRIAAEARNTEVAPPHLLLALLEQEDGLVVPVLQKLGADVAAITARGARDVVMHGPIGSGHHYFIADRQWAFGIEASGHREHTVRRGEVDDFRILEHVDA